ncbi:MAG: hypothetical protein ACJZ92_02230 [Gammaproteobacteria bacterium]
MRIFKLIVLILPLQIFAKLDSQIPLWDQVDKINCRASHSIICVDDDCGRNSSTAFWEINFLDSKITNKTIKYEEKILKKYFEPGSSESIHSIFITSGRMMRFDLDNASTFVFKALSQRSDKNQILGKEWWAHNTYFDCFYE